MKLDGLGSGRAIVVSALAWSLAGGAGCGSSTKVVATPTCTHNSECDSPLVCALGFCVSACVTSRDCPTNERCVNIRTATVPGDAAADGGRDTAATDAAVVDGGRDATATDAGRDAAVHDAAIADGGHGAAADGGVTGGTACQAPESVACHYTSECATPLVCGTDDQCRNQCKTNVDCPGGSMGIEVCTSVSHLCADPKIDTDYDPATNEFRPGSGGTKLDGSTSGKDGSTSGKDGSTAGKDAGIDVPPPTCAAGVAGFHPSNLPLSLAIPKSAAAYTLSGTGTFDTDALTLSDGADAAQWTTMVVKMSGGYEAAVALFDSFTLPSGAALEITGMRPLIIVADGNLEIDGSITAVKSPKNNWYGGGPPAPSTAMRGGLCALNVLAGGGGASYSTADGAGGGGYCGMGGNGSVLGPDAGTPPAGGAAYGVAELVPLAGGASGGSTNGSDVTNHGGGAVELVAGGMITIGDTGVINMGGGGTDPGYGVGGGSGGGILLEAPSVIVRGILTVNGGSGSATGNGQSQPGQPSLIPAVGGGTVGGSGSAGANINGGNAKFQANAAGGGGGAGRIRINTGCGGAFTPSSGAIISPTSATPCFTTGSLN